MRRRRGARPSLHQTSHEKHEPAQPESRLREKTQDETSTPATAEQPSDKPKPPKAA